MEVSGKRHASAALPPGKRPCTHYIRVWVGRRLSLDGRSWSISLQLKFRSESKYKHPTGENPAR
jgi:hypothetical protein